MSRRLALCLLCLAFALLAAVPAGAESPEQRRQEIAAQIARLNEQIAQAHDKEQALRAQITGVSTQIRSLERKVGDVSRKLAPIERELLLREIRLNRLNALFVLQTDRLHLLRQQYAIAETRLNERLVAIYESDEPDLLGVALSTTSFTDFLDSFDYARQIGHEDKRIAQTVGTMRDRVRVALGQTRVARASVLAETRIIAFRVRQVRALRDELLLSRDKLAKQRRKHREDLDQAEQGERNEAEEIRHLRSADEALAAKIRAAQAAVQPEPSQPSQPTDTTPSQAGLIWPVAGPITSGFGPRWGGFHYGLDIAANTGTPIHAAAAGTVIYAGWFDGFGNFVIVDHGNGIATTYGHQSQIAASVGEHVSQGEVIGYVGSTGFSTGPHLDFEVRVNGQPVDPLGYL